MNGFEKQVLSILVNEPSIFNPKIKRLGNVEHAHRIIHKYLPFRIGIEFEYGDKSGDFNPYQFYFNYGVDNGIDELRVSFKSYKYLINLYKLLNHMNETVPFNTGSGIHIHVDASSFFETINTNSIPQSIVDYLIKIADYTGRYNEHKLSTDKEAIRIHSEYSTLEYRIFKMTYDYPVLVKWILICSYINKCVKSHNTIETSIIDELFTL